MKPREFLADVVMTYEGKKCLIWPFARATNGYARIGDGTGRGGRTLQVTRLVCEAAHGPAPTPKHQAAHSCNKGKYGCVAKRHLSWKTRKENEADKLIFDTKPVGEKHGRAKLTEKEVLEILALKGHFGQRRIAVMYNVQQMTISLIHQGKNWSYLRRD